MTEWLLEPFRYSFMQTGLAAAALVGITCATIGAYVVLRRMAFIGDALSHTVLPGLVVAYLNSWNLFWGAIAAGLLTALGIGWVSRRGAAMFALGILLMSQAGSFRDLSHMLFGNILGVRPSDLWLTAGIAAGVLLTLALLHKELELSSYDPTYAEVIGLRADRMRFVLLIVLAFTVVTCIQVVGVILTSALLVTPAAAAALLTNRLPRMMLIAALIAVGSALVGLYASYYANVASGAAIVLTCTACFGLAWLAHSLRTRSVR
jgi:manganese/iron transport system permease protein